MENLKSLFKMVDMQLSHLSEKDRRTIKGFITFGYERGETSVLKTLKKRGK